MSETLHFAEHRLQEMALVFMAVVYILRVRWLMKFKAGRDRQAPTGNSTLRRGILYSWFIIARPGAMESTRAKPFLYAQFVIFHLGVTAAILMSFIIPYASGLMSRPAATVIFQVFIGAAFIVAVMRIVRRAGNKYLRAISTPDDYFSLGLLAVWFLFAFLAASNQPQRGETFLLIYFYMTAFFLVYVPFSKISHYLYYPFTRFYFGRTMGHRGVYPMSARK
ncbi:MAG: hypothetical protein FJY65_09495 [Calditrichaeota bacterium]|nr:hypothetical protein [Calditrichota bacterium]